MGKGNDPRRKRALADQLQGVRKSRVGYWLAAEIDPDKTPHPASPARVTTPSQSTAGTRVGPRELRVKPDTFLRPSAITGCGGKCRAAPRHFPGVSKSGADDTGQA